MYRVVTKTDVEDERKEVKNRKIEKAKRRSSWLQEERKKATGRNGKRERNKQQQEKVKRDLAKQKLQRENLKNKEADVIVDLAEAEKISADSFQLWFDTESHGLNIFVSKVELADPTKPADWRVATGGEKRMLWFIDNFARPNTDKIEGKYKGETLVAEGVLQNSGVRTWRINGSRLPPKIAVTSKSTHPTTHAERFVEWMARRKRSSNLQRTLGPAQEMLAFNVARTDEWRRARAEQKKSQARGAAKQAKTMERDVAQAPGPSEPGPSDRDVYREQVLSLIPAQRRNKPTRYREGPVPRPGPPKAPPKAPTPRRGGPAPAGPPKAPRPPKAPAPRQGGPAERDGGGVWKAMDTDGKVAQGWKQRTAGGKSWAQMLFDAWDPTKDVPSWDTKAKVLPAGKLPLQAEPLQIQMKIQSSMPGIPLQPLDQPTLIGNYLPSHKNIKPKKQKVRNALGLNK